MRSLCGVSEFVTVNRESRSPPKRVRKHKSTSQKNAAFEIEHDMIVISVANSAKIWYNQKDDETPKFVDYELDQSDNHS